MSVLLSSISALWSEKLELAKQSKWELFGKEAADCARFYNNSDHSFAFTAGYGRGSHGLKVSGSDDFPDPSFKISSNKVAQFVQVILPIIAHGNPTRQVNPRAVCIAPELLEMLGIMLPPNGVDPVVHLTAQLMEQYLNYTPNELNLREHSRLAAAEGLIKGRGVLWPSVFQGPKGRMVGSFFESVDNLLIDPDATCLMDAQWIARKRCWPIWRASQVWGTPLSVLQANKESKGQTAELNVTTDGRYERTTGHSSDYIEFYEVYSRMGFGGRLEGSHPAIKELTEQFGECCYLVIAEGIPYPLNIPEYLVSQPGTESYIQEAIQWPTPFYRDPAYPWPFSVFDVHSKPNSPWGASHIGFVLAETKFLEWAMSFLASKVKVNSRDFLVIKDYVGEDLYKGLANGKDMAILPLNPKIGEKIGDCAEFLQHPDMNKDLLTVIDYMQKEFERGSGLSEVMLTGDTNRQLRSASEANMKQQNANVRPDDFAEKFETFMTEVARKEAIMIRYHLGPEDIAPAFGERYDPMTGTGGPFTSLWAQLVMNLDIDTLLGEYDYRIEAGSSRKPNEQKRADDMNLAMQNVLPLLVQVWQTTGDAMPLNNLLYEFAKSIKADPKWFQVPSMQMQQGAPPNGPPQQTPPPPGY